MSKFFAALFLFAGSQLQAQDINKIITQSEVTRIEATLSSDSMEGRATFAAGNDRAATFIAAEMKKAGLKPLPKEKDFMQRFSMYKTAITSATATVDGATIPADNIICISSQPLVAFTEKSDYKIIPVKAGADLQQAYRQYASAKENILMLVDSSFASSIKRIQRSTSSARFRQPNNIVLLFVPNVAATTFSVKIEQTFTEQKLTNVVGYLPGKTQPKEFVVFSGHYDHLGYGKPNAAGDSLYNGANDDASGTTAVLMLARYYKQLGNNARSIIFVAFTAEEIGGFGSRYFSNQLPADSVAAMFNIEMIGTESKWGTASAYITGYEKTDMGKILEQNLKGSAFTFYPDPYPTQQLFYRSDNATLARLGVPAHTISTSKMDNEPHYHKADDSIGTLDMKNMTEIIKAVAISAQSIVMGKDSPSRVDTKQLR